MRQMVIQKINRWHSACGRELHTDPVTGLAGDQIQQVVWNAIKIILFSCPMGGDRRIIFSPQGPWIPEYRKDKRPFHPSPTAADCCCIARQLCNTSPNPAAMEPGALKSSPLLATIDPLPAFGTQNPRRAGLSAASWMQAVILRLLSRTAHGSVQLVAPGFLVRQRTHGFGLFA